MDGGPILIIDDNRAILKQSQVALTAKGCDVHTAADAEEALALLQTLRPRLILVELLLPGIDGLELTRRLKADPATRDIVIVALTAYARIGDEQRARTAGCTGLIAKPFDTRALADAVAGFLTCP